ncbi:MAG TPA: hypothetical protein VN158_02945, partial [Caulobacter sp.]|nr:hypothetical protein [Caulobacter sp.]
LGVEVASSDGRRAQLGVLPIFPDGQAQDIEFDVSVDGGAVEAVRLPRKVGSPAWAEGVLDNLLKVTVDPSLSPGHHTITVTSRTGRVGLDRVRLVLPEQVAVHENH